MTTRFTVQQVLHQIINDEHDYLRTFQLQEATDLLQTYIKQNKLQNVDFETFCRNLPSHMSNIKMTISHNDTKTPNILADICALLETAELKEQTLRAIGIYLCQNTYNSNIFSSEQRMKCLQHIEKEVLLN